jgi:hypothetical protein
MKHLVWLLISAHLSCSCGSADEARPGTDAATAGSIDVSIAGSSNGGNGMTGVQGSMAGAESIGGVAGGPNRLDGCHGLAGLYQVTGLSGYSMSTVPVRLELLNDATCVASVNDDTPLRSTTWSPGRLEIEGSVMFGDFTVMGLYCNALKVALDDNYAILGTATMFCVEFLDGSSTPGSTRSYGFSKM